MSEERKDRLIQTRVPERLETTLKEAARKHRVTVSQMIRNVLEDTFHLVDGVVANVDQIVSDSVELAQQVGKESRRVRSARSGGTSCGDPLEGSAERLARIDAWNRVVLNRPMPCTKCGVELAKGSRVYVGLGAETGAEPGDDRAWLCARAVESLHEDSAE